MQNNFRPFFIEIFWIVISVLLTLLITGLIFGWSFFKGTLDIHLYDTYFVSSSGTIIIPLLLFLNMAIFCIKETRQRFSRTVPNIVILLSGLLLIVFLTNVSKTFLRLSTRFPGGWTAYPPLAEFPVEHHEHPLVPIVVNLITVLQVIVTLALLYITFLWGRYRQQGR